VKSTRWN